MSTPQNMLAVHLKHHTAKAFELLLAQASYTLWPCANVPYIQIAPASWFCTTQGLRYCVVQVLVTAFTVVPSRSGAVRTFEQRTVLEQFNPRCVAVSLSGYIFFGSSVKISDKVLEVNAFHYAYFCSSQHSAVVHETSAEQHSSTDHARSCHEHAHHLYSDSVRHITAHTCIEYVAVLMALSIAWSAYACCYLAGPKSIKRVSCVH